jgi:hypothetical protein
MGLPFEENAFGVKMPCKARTAICARIALAGATKQGVATAARGASQRIAAGMLAHNSDISGCISESCRRLKLWPEKGNMTARFHQHCIQSARVNLHKGRVESNIPAMTIHRAVRDRSHAADPKQAVGSEQSR